MSADKIYGKLFLSVGAMKAGTTWLYSLLHRHPELYFSLEKELHYIYDAHAEAPKKLLRRRSAPGHLTMERRMQRARDIYLPRIWPDQDTPVLVRQKRDGIIRYLKNPVDDAWYAGLFEDKPEGAYSCDFSNLSSLLSAENWRQVAAKCSQLNVMYSMRDPVERLWSHAKFTLEHSGRAESIGTWGPKDYRKLLQEGGIKPHIEYGKVVRTLRAALPEHSILLLFYEDIHADRLGALRQIETFLGIAAFDYPEALFERRQASSMKHDMPDFFPDIVAEDAARIKSELRAEGLTIPDSWR